MEINKNIILHPEREEISQHLIEIGYKDLANTIKTGIDVYCFRVNQFRYDYLLVEAYDIFLEQNEFTKTSVDKLFGNLKRDYTLFTLSWDNGVYKEVDLSWAEAQKRLFGLIADGQLFKLSLQKLPKLPKLKGKEYTGSMRGDIYYDHLDNGKRTEADLKRIAEQDSGLLTLSGFKHQVIIDKILGYPVIVIENRGDQTSEDRYLTL